MSDLLILYSLYLKCILCILMLLFDITINLYAEDYVTDGATDENSIVRIKDAGSTNYYCGSSN